MKTKTFTTSEHDAGLRLDKWLSDLAEINSRSFAQDLILKKQIKVDQKEAKSSQLLKTGQSIEIQFPEVKAIGLVPYNYKLDIVFEDDDLLVINKPSGLVVHPAAGHEQDTLVNALIFHTTQLSMKNELRPGIVHRLDKETSGLLVVAKNDVTHEHLSEQFKNKTTHRIYYAAVEKKIERASGIIQSYLARHPVDRKRYASLRENKALITKFKESMTAGKWAVTHFKNLSVCRTNKNLYLSYLQLKLETGRTHQIRVHLSEAGHPVVGDKTYGASSALIKVHQLDRFYLHAAELGFVHPKTNEALLFKCKWPQRDIQKLIQLGFTNELFGM